MKISPEKYAQLIYSSTKNLGKKDVDLILVKIANLINKNGDKGNIRKILNSFTLIFNKEQRIVEVETVSKEKLSQKNIDYLKEKMADKFSTKSEKIHLKQSVQPDILAGTIIRVGNVVWDGSMRNKLEKLRTSLINK